MEHDLEEVVLGKGEPNFDTEKQRHEREYHLKIAKLEEKINQMQDIIDKLLVYYANDSNSTAIDSPSPPPSVIIDWFECQGSFQIQKTRCVIKEPE